MERSDIRQKTDRENQVLGILAKSVRRIIQGYAGGLEGLQEIRLRTGQPVRIVQDNKEEIQSEVLAAGVTLGNVTGYVKDWNINGEDVTLGVERV